MQFDNIKSLIKSYAYEMSSISFLMHFHDPGLHLPAERMFSNVNKIIQLGLGIIIHLQI